MSEFEKLFESGLLDEDTKKALKEAIESKVRERLEEEKDNLRESFGRRYEHDKKVMVEAAEKMFNDVLRKELKDFHSERQQFVESKVKYKKMIREHAKVIKHFATKKLHEEIVELRSDRKQLTEAMMHFEKFAVKQLTKELVEFHQDKRDLHETRVKLIKEAKGKIGEAKKDFVKKASIIAEAFIKESVLKEIGELRQDIKEARKNNFGRKLFEAFAAEFMVSHASDGTQLKKLMNAVKERETKINEAVETVKKQKDLIKKLNNQKHLVENKLVRTKKMNQLLSPLPRDKKELMAELLESVETKRLDEAYKKHIKYVLNENVKGQKQPLSEENQRKGKSSLKEVTGNRLNESVDSEVEDEEILTLKRRAGII